MEESLEELKYTQPDFYDQMIAEGQMADREEREELEAFNESELG